MLAHPSRSDSIPAVIGWDVGGAHLKAVVIDAQGLVLEVLQIPCALWRGLSELEQATSKALAKLSVTPHRHALTMTGELVDIFINRHEGVLAIAQAMQNQLTGQLSFYAGRQGFVDIAAVAKHSAQIASANWLASADFVATQVAEGLLIDIGSTTADFVVLAKGQAQPQGFSDAERMRFDELVYTGVVRTPLMALCHKITFAGHEVNIAAEHFATTADVYRLTAELVLAEDMADTADGAGKTQFESARRLARMIGHDVESFDMATWEVLAHAFKNAQLEILKQAIHSALSRGLLTTQAPLIGAGAGRFLVAQLASEMNRAYIELESLIPKASHQQTKASLCLPAYAVAKLAQDLRHQELDT